MTHGIVDVFRTI